MTSDGRRRVGLARLSACRSAGKQGFLCGQFEGLRTTVHIDSVAQGTIKARICGLISVIICLTATVPFHTRRPPSSMIFLISS